MKSNYLTNRPFSKTSLLLLFFVAFATKCHLGLAQTNGSFNRTISGIVLDETDEPLPAAHIKQVSQNRGEAISAVAADIQGHFNLTVDKMVKEIEVSYLGYTTQIIKLTNKDSYIITLLPASELLNEVVVTGYQTISRERATGSFAKVNSEQLELKRLNSLSNLLEGQVAGYNNGLIRGTTSMNGMTSPLYVIDGFPVENTRYNSNGSLEEHLPDLNMEDIETITVLKDAAASSIYGARAANGVIVITTKRAAKGKTKVSFSSTFTVNPYNYYVGNHADAATLIGIEKEWAQNNPNLQGDGAAAYASSMLSQAVYNSGGIRTILKGYAGQLSNSEVNNQLDQMAVQGYRYYDQVENYTKRNPFSQQYNLSVGKTTDSNSFNASATYKNNALEDKNASNESIGVNLINSLKVNSWVSFDVGTYFMYETGTTQSYSALNPGYTYMPYDAIANADGTPYTSAIADRTSESYQNTINKYGLYNMDITPLDEVNRNLINNQTISNRSYAKLNLTFTPWLKYSAMFQYEYGGYRTNQLKDKNSYTVRSQVNSFATLADGGIKYNLPYGNIYSTEDQYSHAYNFRQQFDFSKTFAEKHEVVAILGSETRHNKVDYTSNNLYNYDPDMLSYTAIDGKALASVYGILGGGSWGNRNMTYMYEATNRFVSFYGNAGYTYDNRYIATGSLRWDRSNLWGTDSKYQNKPLWSVGGSWNVHNEAFFEPTWVDMLKVRFSYGIGGNIAKDAAPYMTANYNPNYNVGGIYGSVSSRPNPELSWEKTTTTNVGVDFSLWRGRLSGSIDYYNKKGEDLLANTMGVPTEGFGYSTYKVNNGKMVNKGIEITLSGDVIRTKDFQWNASLLYGYNKNEVTYVNVEAPFYVLQLDYPEAYPRIGNPYSAIYAYKWAGLDEKGRPQVYDANGNASAYNPASLEAIVYAGSTVPTYSGSVGSSFRYKDVELSFLLVYEGGHKMRNSFLPFLGGSYSSAMGGYITNLSASVNANIANRWQQAGDEQHTDVPRIVFAESKDYLYDSESVYGYADINVLDASNIRLSNVSLSYRLPVNFCQKLLLNGARIQFNAENLFTLAQSKEAKYLLGGYNSPNLIWGLYLNF